jgi:transposase-like protein
MDASKQFCPNEACSARGKRGAGNISIHGRKRPRYKCQTCGKTFSARRGTVLEGLRTPEEVVMKAILLLAYGCPPQAIVHAFGVDERTVADWQRRAGKHCQQVHETLVQHGNVPTQHVQADEIRVKGRKMIAWMGLAMEASTRLWRAGSGQCESRQDLGRSLAPTGSCLLPGRPSAVDLYRWLECVSKEHPACVSRKSEKDPRQGKSLFRGVAAAVYGDRDQTYAEETGRGSDTQADLGNA